MKSAWLSRQKQILLLNDWPRPNIDSSIYTGAIIHWLIGSRESANLFSSRFILLGNLPDNAPCSRHIWETKKSLLSIFIFWHALINGNLLARKYVLFPSKAESISSTMPPKSRHDRYSSQITPLLPPPWQRTNRKMIKSVVNRGQRVENFRERSFHRGRDEPWINKPWSVVLFEGSTGIAQRRGEARRGSRGRKRGEVATQQCA